ncbi:AAA family ATPase, partial [Cylindrospermopsis raciborskii CS-506_C]
QWDWSRKFPVIKIDFAGGVLKNRQELDQKINGIFLKTAQSLGVDYELEDIQGRFGEIIAGAYHHRCFPCFSHFHCYMK